MGSYVTGDWNNEPKQKLYQQMCGFLKEKSESEISVGSSKGGSSQRPGPKHPSIHTPLRSKVRAKPAESMQH